MAIPAQRRLNPSESRRFGSGREAHIIADLTKIQTESYQLFLQEDTPPEKRKELIRQPGVSARVGATARLTERQLEAEAVLASEATHCMLFGGSRSGKTFLILRSLIARGLAHQSRHAVLRFRFNHLKASIVYDTLPKVMKLSFPGALKDSKLDKSD